MASEIWAGFMRRLICMFAGVLLFILAFVSFSDAASTNTFYASQFPGVTVADKVTRAPNDCVRVFAGLQNCRVVISADLAGYATGTLPALCTKCTVEDWRAGTPYMTGAVVEVPFASFAATWTMSAAQAELGTVYYRRRFDAGAYSQYRVVISCTVAASAGTTIKAQFSADNVTFADAETGGRATGNIVTFPTGAVAGTWVPLNVLARGDVYFRLVVSGGDGTTRSCLNTAIQFKP
jgi:hypothetical protein